MAVWPWTLSPYEDEWRGNKITKSQVYRVVGRADGPARIVDLCTSDDIVDQIKLTAPGRCLPQTVPSELTGEYSHRIYFPDGPGIELEALLDLLSKVLSIRITDTDVTVAFDWYKIPPDEEHDYWRDTPLGRTRKTAKFYVNSPGMMEDARVRLVKLMAAFIDRHPLYKAAGAIIATPGSDRTVISCGEDLAQRVAAAVGKELVMTDTAYVKREQAKGDAKVDLTGQFSMPISLSDRAVIVIDDAIRSSNTMRHMALAARQAGARRVLGLAPVRTMRGS